MTKEKIIEEGLLEQYLTGDLDITTQRRVEEVLSNDSSLHDLFMNLESDFEYLSVENSIAVPNHVKIAVMNSIKSQEPTTVKPKPFSSYKTWFSLAAAASIVLFLNTIYLIVQNGSMQEQLTTIESETTYLKKTQQTLESAFKNQEQLLTFLSDPATDQYTLEGNTKMPEMRLVSYINHKVKKVMVNTSELTPLQYNQDYQMWADVEGKMINMGIINLDQSLTGMDYVEHAESINITLEPKGGSKNPTVTNLISNTYLK